MPGFRKTRKTRKGTRRRFKGGLSGAGRSRKKRSGGGRKKKSRKNIGGAAYDHELDHMVGAVQNKAWADQLVAIKRDELEGRLREGKLLVDPTPKSTLYRAPLSAAEQQKRDDFLEMLMDDMDSDEDPGPNLEDDEKYKQYLAMLDGGVSQKDVEEEMERNQLFFFEVLKMPRGEPAGDNPYLNCDETPMTDPNDRKEVKKRNDKIKKEEAEYLAKKAGEEQAAADYDRLPEAEQRKIDIDKMCAKYYNDLIRMVESPCLGKKFQDLLVKHGIRSEGDYDMSQHKAKEEGDFFGGKSRSSSKKKRRRRTRRQR